MALSSARWVQNLRRSYAYRMNSRPDPKDEVVLVTGAFGQIGRDFVPLLRELFGSSNVIATDITKPENVSYDVAEKVVELDVCDKAAVKDAVKSFKVNRIVHLATMLSAVGEKLPIKGEIFGKPSAFLA